MNNSLATLPVFMPLHEPLSEPLSEPVGVTEVATTQEAQPQEAQPQETQSQEAQPLETQALRAQSQGIRSQGIESRRYWLSRSVCLASMCLFAHTGLAYGQQEFDNGLSKQQAASLWQRMINYFDSFKTLRGRITQTVLPNGKVDQGSLLLRRPGMMRIDYDTPNPLQVVADGVNLIIFNRETKQRTEIPLNFTPAAYILSDKLKRAREKISIRNARENDSIISVRLAEKGDLDKGAVTLHFRKDQQQKMIIGGWDVHEPNGVVTQVRITQPEVGVNLPIRLFSS